MSKRDARKALSLHLPPSVRKRLRAQARGKDGLAATARRLFRRVMDQTEGGGATLEPPEGPPILLQLSHAEQARLTEIATARGVSEETALLQLLIWALGAPR